MEIKILTALVFLEGGLYVARCKEFLITEVGNSEEEAVSKLRKTIENYSKEYKLKTLSVDISKYFENSKEIKFQVTIYGGGKT